MDEGGLNGVATAPVPEDQSETSIFDSEADDDEGTSDTVCGADDTAIVHPAEAAIGPVALEVEEEEVEELTGWARLLPNRRSLGVFLTNGALHVLIVVILALIILPAEPNDVLQSLTSKIEAVDTFEDIVIEDVEVQPEQIDATAPLTESPQEMLSDSNALMDININDLEVAAPEVKEILGTTGAPTAVAKGEFGGRSKAGRAAMVAQYGGSVASEAAVQRGLQWLRNHQQEDGSWSYAHSVSGCNCGNQGSAADVRMGATGMALLAMAWGRKHHTGRCVQRLSRIGSQLSIEERKGHARRSRSSKRL